MPALRFIGKKPRRTLVSAPTVIVPGLVALHCLSGSLGMWVACAHLKKREGQCALPGIFWMGELHLQEGHLYFLLGLGLLVLSYVLLLRLGVHHLESLLHPVLRMVRLYGARDSIQMPEPSLPVVHQLVMAAQQLIRHLIGDATLVGNAIKYGGSAHIHLSETSKGAAIRVTDPGPGVPEEMLAKVFEPFVRLNRCGPSSGTGLGLTIARNLVHAHGGDIQLSNRPEGGLEAMFTLPVSLRQTSA